MRLSLSAAAKDFHFTEHEITSKLGKRKNYKLQSLAGMQMVRNDARHGLLKEEADRFNVGKDKFFRVLKESLCWKFLVDRKYLHMSAYAAVFDALQRTEPESLYVWPQCSTLVLTPGWRWTREAHRYCLGPSFHAATRELLRVVNRKLHVGADAKAAIVELVLTQLAKVSAGES